MFTDVSKNDLLRDQFSFASNGERYSLYFLPAFDRRRQPKSPLLACFAFSLSDCDLFSPILRSKVLIVRFMMAGAVKKTTGLTGLMVARNPQFTLTTLYTKILGTLAKMPQEAAYRKHTEKLVNERLAIVSDEINLDNIEKRIQGGQIEELIVQAESELLLSRRMLKWKPWEPLIEEPPKNQWKWPV